MKPDSITPPAGATTLTTNPDAAILAAWERLSANRMAGAELNDESPGYDEEEERLWTAIGKDEKLICESVAKSLVGAEIQLGCILSHDVATCRDESAVMRRDLQYFDNNEVRFDLAPLIALQAIRSLRAIGGEQ
jgi:hypothetical protein